MLVRTAGDAADMAFQLACVKVRRIGLDSEFRHGPPAEAGDDIAGLDDVSQLHPISVGVVAIVDNAGTDRAIQYCVDVRRPDTFAGLRSVLLLPTTFVVHHLKSEYMALRKLGLPWPSAYFDTWLAAHLLTLGRHHARYEVLEPEDEHAEMEAEETAKEKRRSAAALLSLALKYAIEHPFDRDKDRMRARYLALPNSEALNELDAAYVCADAATAALLHVPMRLDLLEAGLDRHYDQIELPAAVEFADMEWHGVLMDVAKIKLAHDAADIAVLTYERKLAPVGFRTVLATPDQIAAGARAARVMVTSYEERKIVFARLGLLHLFRSKKATRGYSFNKKLLKQHRAVHPVINLLYLHGKYTGIAKDKLFDGHYIGRDGRVHPYIHPLGADSGRVSTKRPNLLGIGKMLRPIVVVDGNRYALVELDYSQEEIFIAAAVYGDEVLMADCNAGDVYCEMVRRFCAAELDPGDEALTDVELIWKYGELRGRWKIITLAIIYGMTDTSVVIGAKLASVAAARQLREQFFGRYYQLRDGIDRAVMRLQARGFTETVTGMKRYRGQSGPLSAWEKRWAVNAPVQGGGACVLKLVLPRVARYLRARGGRVVLAIHDALLVLVPVAEQQELVNGSKALMIDGLRELYPGAEPRVDVNDADTSCWNYKGFGDSIERFVEDPEFDFKR